MTAQSVIKKILLNTAWTIALLIVGVGKIYSASISFTPSGSQLDADPINDILVLPSQNISFDLEYNPTGLVIPILPWSSAEINWSFSFDNIELQLISNTNPSPTTIIPWSTKGTLSTLLFNAVNPNPWPGDGLPDFGLTLNSVILYGDFGGPISFDATSQFSASEPIEVQQAVPEPVSTVLLFLGLGLIVVMRLNSSRQTG